MGTLMNDYRITYQDNTEKHAIRQNMSEAAKDFESVDNPLCQITRVRTGLDVAVPEPLTPVHFLVNVTPLAAVDAECKAAPSAFTVVNNTAVVFEALPGAGFDFTGWFLDAPVNLEDAPTFDPTVPVSTDLTAVIVITAPGPGLERKVEARFEPAVP